MSGPGGEAQVRVVQRRTRRPRRRHVRRPTRARGSPSIEARSEASGLGFIPSASSGRSPAPIPRIIRPPEISSTVAAAAAVIAGCRVSGFVTAVPSSSRERRRRGERQVRVGVPRVQRRIGEPQVVEPERVDPRDHVARTPRAGTPPAARRRSAAGSCRQLLVDARTVRASVRTPSGDRRGVDPLLRRVLARAGRDADRDRRGCRARARRSRPCSSRPSRTSIPASRSASPAARTSGCAGSRRPAGRSPSTVRSTRSGSVDRRDDRVDGARERGERRRVVRAQVELEPRPRGRAR